MARWDETQEEGSAADEELTEEEKQAPSVSKLPENPKKSQYTYQVDSDAVTILIIGVILLIAILLAIIGAILIRRN